MTDLPKETKKPDPRARVTFSSVGRKIGQRLIRLLGEDGEELGTMHRAEVIRMMDQTGLKLVAINENSDPPLYRLMKGKQIHEEQMRLRETQKAKTGAFMSCLSVSSVFFEMFLKAITILSLFARPYQSKSFVLNTTVCLLSLHTLMCLLAGPVQSKELNFSSDISLHDLETKLRQVVSWLEKKNHVRLTIKGGAHSGTPLV